MLLNELITLLKGILRWPLITDILCMNYEGFNWH